MKLKFLSYAVAAAAIFAGAEAIAGNHNGANHGNTAKQLSKVSDVQNMADDSMVYVQGYIIENLGDENYVFQDDSGKINVEIDDDLMKNASIAPEAVVWIAATVDKDTGQPVSLEAEEIQIMPVNSNASMTMSNNSNN